MTPKEYYFEENCYITELLNNPLDPAVSVARVRVLPHEKTKWHHLEGITERYLILEGVGFATVGDNPPEEVRESAIVHIPPGIRQRIANSGDNDLIFLAICTPRFDPGKYLAG
ncbi:MAG: cupin domain-containing protein [Bacteroidales bacterium]